MSYDYRQHYPIHGWFIDGEHTRPYVLHESREAIKSGARLIIWHDADIPEVLAGILEAFEGNTDYFLFDVEDTRIAYALRK
jgi:hypothetical protein